MGKFRKFFSIVVFTLLLSGCNGKPPQAPNLVTGIHVAGVHQDAPLEIFYSDPRKMEAILYYLRSLEDLGAPDTDPERIMGDRFKITVSFTDGSQNIYRQQADRFLSYNSHPWQKVDPRKAGLLYPLLCGMEADHSSGVSPVKGT